VLNGGRRAYFPVFYRLARFFHYPATGNGQGKEAIMDSKLRVTGRLVAVLAILGLVASCGPGYIEGGYGRVYLELNAAGTGSGIADGVLEAWAMIDEVSVHMAGGGGWKVLSDTPVNVDLLRLPDHAADLGFGLIPSGKVTGIRLHVQVGSQSYVVEEGGSIVPMDIPSGMKSGILVKGKWNIGPCTENVIGLTSSDHHNAIHVHPDGQSTRYIFRPVIFAGEMLTEEGECEDPGDDNPGNGPGDRPGDDPELGGGDDGDDGQECIPGDDAFPCPGGSTGHDDSGDDGSGDGSDVGTDDGTGVGTGDGTGDGVGGDDGSGDDGEGGFVDPNDGWNVNPGDMPGVGDGTDDGSGDDGSGGGSDDLPCDPAVDDTCRP